MESRWTAAFGGPDREVWSRNLISAAVLAVLDFPSDNIDNVNETLYK